MHLSGVLIDVDFRDHRDVAVVALVADAGDASAADALPVRAHVRTRGRARLPLRGLRGGAHASLRRGVTQMPKPIRDRIGLDLRRDLVQETLVRERVLQTLRSAQRPGEEGRSDAMRDDALAANDAGAVLRLADASGDV